MQRLCPLCRHAVTIDESGALCYCGTCGAPQVRVPEDFSVVPAAAAVGSGAAFDRPAEGTGVPLAAAGASAHNWRGAIQCALLAGGVAVAFELVSLAFPAVSILATFWAVGAPVVALGIYSSKFQHSRIDAGFGARLGLLCGLAIVTGLSAVQAGDLTVRRFLLHSTADFDKLVDVTFAQASATAIARSGPDVKPYMHIFLQPEFRAGILLSIIGIGSLLYLIFSAAGGAFAGMLRARRPNQ